MSFLNDTIPCAYCGEYPTVTVSQDNRTHTIVSAIAVCENKKCPKCGRHTKQRTEMQLLAEDWNDIN